MHTPIGLEMFREVLRRACCASGREKLIDLNGTDGSRSTVGFVQIYLDRTAEHDKVWSGCDVSATGWAAEFSRGASKKAYST